MTQIIETPKAVHPIRTGSSDKGKWNAKGVIAAVVLVTITASCNRTETKKAEEHPKPVTFSESMFMGVTPTADGGAYAIGLDSGLWYLRGSEAVIVQFPALPADEADMMFFLGLQITPLADGGAFAHSQIEKSIWYLREGTARKVRDVPVLTTKPVSGDLDVFPLYVTERAKRLHAEKELEERQEQQEANSDGDE